MAESKNLRASGTKGGNRANSHTRHSLSHSLSGSYSEPFIIDDNGDGDDDDKMVK